MPALEPTDVIGTITWLGHVPHRKVENYVDGAPLTEMPLSFAGLEGEVHAGLTRPSCSRVLKQYKRNTEIRNVRQLSIVSAEELAEIAADLGLEAIDPVWMGASVVIEGIPDFTHIPPSSRLQAEGGCTLTVDMLNMPCQLPARTIETARPGHGKRFKTAAKGKRGVTAWVEREGVLRLGATVRLHVPTQRPWRAPVAG
ncbi:MOSC domain-containing protein [Flavimaricola marinus]|uniref:Putative metal-sulfur cluster biosynthesis proteins YuaD n=1 Tax=Flavimaricola marinus TaxID=1819565 RepID=A0A238LCD9_9RHOB|nr:MOSC domain-containing protein [Flavimaricola marinus]SMY06606.1 Putative metal-sulfur cluster biosynthesis proteins YuaD [Flavimaricola marinus]